MLFEEVARLVRRGRPLRLYEIQKELLTEQLTVWQRSSLGPRPSLWGSCLASAVQNCQHEGFKGLVTSALLRAEGIKCTPTLLQPCELVISLCPCHAKSEDGSST